MKSELVLAVGLFLLSNLLCGAQTVGQANLIPPPKEPLVALVPESAQWTITVSYSDGSNTGKSAGSKPTHRLRQIASVKTQELKHDVLIYDDGKTEETWYSGKMVLIPSSNGQRVALADFESTNEKVYGEEGNPVSSLGFPGVGWLKLKYYDKVVPIQNFTCYHYLLATSGGCEAWIDVRTGFPVAYRAGGMMCVYGFMPKPAAPLVLPPQFQETLKLDQRIKDRRQQLENDGVH